ncbi:endonuclease domain-containing protein [Methylobacterium goesingense]|uniref:endonuclease domain-containing protein n=1 Tax=Methylobacterium goesingense TaxID=243690 RepID=UPI0024B5F1DD|nr:DUF559 domain-containing protein [Methylobacterium goesingense]
MPWRESPSAEASPRALVHARVLRRTSTGAERRLWRHLRHRLPLQGSHFRRQVALGPYVADFCCLSARLIVEVDGGQHTLDHSIVYDEARTISLERQGFRVLRVTNTDVMHRIDDVLETIRAALAIIPSPTHGPAEPGV